jgi:hypothetical protein
LVGKGAAPVQSSAAARLLQNLIIGAAKFSASAYSATRTFAKVSAIASSAETISNIAESCR